MPVNFLPATGNKLRKRALSAPTRPTEVRRVGFTGFDEVWYYDQGSRIHAPRTNGDSRRDDRHSPQVYHPATPRTEASPRPSYLRHKRHHSHQVQEYGAGDRRAVYDIQVDLNKPLPSPLRTYFAEPPKPNHRTKHSVEPSRSGHRSTYYDSPPPKYQTTRYEVSPAPSYHSSHQVSPTPSYRSVESPRSSDHHRGRSRSRSHSTFDHDLLRERGRPVQLTSQNLSIHNSPRHPSLLRLGNMVLPPGTMDDSGRFPAHLRPAYHGEGKPFPPPGYMPTTSSMQATDSGSSYGGTARVQASPRYDKYLSPFNTPPSHRRY